MFINRFTLDWPTDTLHFGGGGGPSAEEQAAAQRRQREQDKAMAKMLASLSKPVKMPEFSIPDPPPAVPVPPPPTQRQSDIEDAQYDARKAAAKRYGFMRTTYAGSTGGYMATPLGSSNAGGAATLG